MKKHLNYHTTKKSSCEFNEYLVVKEEECKCEQHTKLFPFPRNLLQLLYHDVEGKISTLECLCY